MVTPAARGFTAVELMLAVAIVAILGAVAAPNLKGLLDNQGSRAAASDLHTALMLTRSEAIKRNAEITLTPVDANAWQKGWHIDVNANTTVQNHGAIKGATITGPASVAYLPNGRIKGTADASFSIKFDQADYQRCVKVDLSGRPLVQKGTCQ